MTGESCVTSVLVFFSDSAVDSSCLIGHVFTYSTALEYFVIRGSNTKMNKTVMRRFDENK